MTYFIISHLPTGNIFPQIFRPGQTGFDFCPIEKCSPRLWKRESDAMGWLTVYCKGTIFKEFNEIKKKYELCHDSRDNRKREEYKIIPVTLTNK